jgi:hypothetical protein
MSESYSALRLVLMLAPGAAGAKRLHVALGEQRVVGGRWDAGGIRDGSSGWRAGVILAADE